MPFRFHGRSRDGFHGRGRDGFHGRSRDGFHGRSRDGFHGRGRDGFHGRSRDGASPLVWPRGATIALILTLFIGLAGLELHQTWDGRSRDIEESRRDVVNLAWSAARHAEIAFRLADTILIGIAEQVENDGDGPVQRERLRGLTAAIMANTPSLEGLAVIDETGTLIVRGLPVVNGLSRADRAFFQYHREHSDRLPYVSEARGSGTMGNWIVSVSRRMNHPDGSFAGVVVATVDVNYFQNFYATLDLGHDGSAALFRDDGRVLVRQPRLEAATGTLQSASPLFHDFLPAAASGTFEVNSPLDGMRRINGYRRVAGFPLVVLVSLGKDEALADWRAGALQHVATLIAVTLLMGFLAVRLDRQMRMLARAERTAAISAAGATVAADRYRLLADTATEMIVAIDMRLIRRYVSPGCLAIMGYAPDELVGETPGANFHPDDAERVTGVLRSLAAGRDRDRITYRVRHRDGRWVWVEAMFRLIRDPASGAPREIHGALRDVSQRMEMEAALRESEERLGLLLQSDVAEAMYLLDPDGIIESWNATAERIKGYTAAEIIGQNFAVFFTLEDLARNEPERVLAVARDSGQFTAEALRVRKDGSRFLARVAIVPVRKDDGTPRGFVNVTYDITQLRIEEEERAIIIESAPNGMLIIDEAGAITRANSQAERIFGYPRGTLLGQRAALLVPGAWGVTDVPEVTGGRGDNSVQQQRQYAGRKRDGGTVPVEIMLNAIETPRGRIVVASLFDITDRLRQAAEQQEAEARERHDAAVTNARLDHLARNLEAARDQAEEANKAKSRFLTMITHELRTPLHGILGYAQLLSLEGGLNAGQAERVAAMMTAGEHLLGMINSVLDMSQIEAGRMELHPVEIELTEFARRCLNLVRPAAAAKGLALRLVSDGPLGLRTDSTRLRQALINLLGNAIKFTPTGSIEVRLRHSSAGEFARLEVADTGPGIRAQYHDKMFQTFERLNANAVIGIEGAGLGLAITARLIRLMGGEIGYHDNPGGGSVFWVELPALDGAALSRAKTSTTPMAARQGLRLLVVDDEALNRDIAGGFLRFGNHEVVCIDNGAEAVELAAAQDFDVILMDVRMPGTDGLEATRLIRRLPAPRGEVPVIAVTAQAFAEQIEICRQAGMGSHVSKPFTQAALLAAVEAAARPPRGTALGSPRPVAARAEPLPELPDFDRAVFDAAAAVLRPDEVAAYIETLIARGEKLLDGLRLPGWLADPGELAEIAHSLGGGAGTCGFMALSQIARRFEYAAEAGATDAMSLAEQLSTRVETATAIMRREIDAMAAAGA